MFFSIQSPASSRLSGREETNRSNSISLQRGSRARTAARAPAQAAPTPSRAVSRRKAHAPRRQRKGTRSMVYLMKHDFWKASARENGTAKARSNRAGTERRSDKAAMTTPPRLRSSKGNPRP